MAEKDSQIYELGACRGPVDGGPRDQRTPVEGVTLGIDQSFKITPNCPEFTPATGRCGLTGDTAHCIFFALNDYKPFVRPVESDAVTEEQPKEPPREVRLYRSVAQTPLNVIARRAISLGIITGDVPVGSPVPVVQYATIFGVSRQVIKDAREVLEKQGILKPGKLGKKEELLAQDPRDIPTTTLNPSLRAA